MRGCFCSELGARFVVPLEFGVLLVAILTCVRCNRWFCEKSGLVCDIREYFMSSTYLKRGIFLLVLLRD